MKKLLIATMAAVSVGLCAKAEDTGVISETSFEGLEAGSDFNFEENKNYWQKSAGEDDLFKIIDVVYPQDATTQHWDLTTGEKALSIDTANPILRNVNEQSDTDNSYPAQPVTTPVFFDSVVQFTATDVRPQVDVATNKDKLSVWLYASPENLEEGAFEETEAKTNLVITAGRLEEGSLVQEDYLTDVEISSETWHRLTIKSFIGESGRLMFNVFIDGDSEPISVKGVKDFVSLVEVNDATEDIKLQGVAFDGKGAVDDIVFTTTNPFAEAEPENFTIKIEEDDAYWAVLDKSYSIDDGDSIELTDLSLSVPVNTKKIKFTVNFDADADGDYTLVAKLGDSDLNVTKSGDVCSFEVNVENTAGGATLLVSYTVVPYAGGSAKPTVGGNSYETGADLKAVVKSGTEIAVPSGWAVDGKVLKDDKGATFATFEYYNLALADGIVTATLDQKAAAPFADATDDKEVLEVGEDASGNPKLTVRIKPYVGLYYGAMTGSALDNMTLTTDYQQATTDKVIEFTATGNAGDTAGFIKVVVTDIDPKAK